MGQFLQDFHRACCHVVGKDPPVPFGRRIDAAHQLGNDLDEPNEPTPSASHGRAFIPTAYPEALHRIHDAVVRVRQGLPGVGVPLHRGEAYRPLLIVGAGRSGTTLLRRLLNSHPGLHIPPENPTLAHAVKLFRRNRGLAWPDLVALILGQFAFRLPSEIFPLSFQEVFASLCRLPPEQRSLARIIGQFYSAHAAHYGKAEARWGDKTPAATFILPRLNLVFPGAQFVHLIRDGVDVAYSTVACGMYPTVRDAATRWQKAVGVARRFGRRHPGRVLEVRYESLVIDPATVIERICDFAGLEFSPTFLDVNTPRADMPDVHLLTHMTNVQRPVSKQSIGKGRRSLSLEDREVLEETIGDTLLQLGYESCLADAEVADGAACRSRTA